MMRAWAFAILAIASTAHAGGFAVAEQSSVAASTGGAGTAREGDASAAWYNPAALADGKGSRIGLGVTVAAPQVESRAMDGSWTAKSQSQVLTPPHFFASYARGDAAAGLAINVPYGAAITWPDRWAGQFEAESTSLTVFRAAPFVAYRFGTVRLAAGAHFDFARLDLARRLDFVDTTGDVALSLAGTGVGADAALYWSPCETLQAGISYKSRTALNLDGNAVFHAPIELAGKAADQGVRSQMTLPDRIAAGLRLHAGSAVDILTDVELTMWSTNDALAIHFANDASLDQVQRNGWSNTLAVRGGIEWRPHADWALRAGAFFDPSPAPDSTMSSIAPDFTRVGATAGIGARLSHSMALDVFYEYIQLGERIARNVDSLAARYGGQAHLVGLGLSYRD